MHDNGDGSHAGRFKASSLRASMLKNVLEAFTNPTRRSTGIVGPPCNGDGESRIPRPELLGCAFGELVERLHPTRIPTAGGVNATIVVLVDFDTLLRGLGAARLHTGEHISAALRPTQLPPAHVGLVRAR